MGHVKTNGVRGARALLGACAAALLCLAFASQAQADPPAHPRKAALDVTGLNHACGAAVDNKGDVYASSAGDSKIKVYAPGNHTTPIAEISNTNEPCALAVSTKGDLLVSERATGEVVRYTPDAYPLTATPVYGPREVIDGSTKAEGIAVDPVDDRLYVAEGDRVAVYSRSEVQSLSMTGSGGSFKLRFEGAETAPIAFGASAAEVQAALEALATIDPGEVAVSGSYTITFQGTLSYIDVPQVEGVSSLTGSEKQKLTVKASAGTYKLSFEGEETAAIAFNASAAEVQTALEALGKIAPGDVAVSGGPGDAGGTAPYEVAFGGGYADANVNQLSADASGLAGGTASLSTTSQGAGMTILPSTSSGGLGTDEIQQLALEGTAGTYTLSFEGEETAPIAYDASAAEVQAALEALGAFAPGDLAVGASGFGGFQTYRVGFGGTYAATDVPQLDAVSTALSPSETQRVTVKASAGTYTLAFEEEETAEETAPIAFNASAAEVQAALEALGKLAPGDVAVSGGPGDAGGTSPYEVAFGGAYAGRDLAEMTSSGSGLSGGSASVTTRTQGAIAVTTATAGWSGHALEGLLTEATGVAAYTNPNALGANLKLNLAVADGAGDELKIYSGPASTLSLKLRKTITGVDHDEDPGSAEQEFSFGTAGAYLAADPGNEDTTTGKCTQVQVNGVDQACTQGHFYLHDAGNGAIDEFDTTGELFARIVNPALEDAEPTALAVERSGVTGDGTLYAGSGSGAGAKLLAFAPVLKPSRSQLAEPLSKVLAGARAVATDCEGYVYVAAQTLVHVYSPEGSKMTSFEVPSTTLDLAADCKGNVYIVPTTGTEMTYYSPSAYPPTGSTAYTRKTPALVTDTGLAGVAVNPANEHVFLVGNQNFAPVIKELAPPSEGSKAEGECGAGLGLANARADIDVYGKTGYVYISANLSASILYVLKCGKVAAEAELIREAKEGAGCPSGKTGGVNPRIAVDQSNGHVVEWATNQPGNTVREYDALGACLAEFGTTSSNVAGYRLAIDNSCALHGLTESTTPTCAATYLSSGNAYLAFDSSNNTIQPFDVNAFGPLEYPEEPEPEEFTLSITSAGTGTGEVKCKFNGGAAGACTSPQPNGTSVEIIATANSGSTFAGFSATSGSAASCTTSPCAFTLEADSALTATFNPIPRSLTITEAGGGTGNVKCEINAGPVEDCAGSYPNGTAVKLSATANGGSTFAGFSATSGSASACTTSPCGPFTLEADSAVTATFEPDAPPVEELPLTVAPEGTGTGEVTSSPAGIDCGGTCTAQFEAGQEVTLTASPAPGSLFVAWKYCDTEGVQGRQCTVHVTPGHKAVGAKFEPANDVTVKKAGDGTGSISGVACANTCTEATAAFLASKTVTLKAKPYAKNSEFVGWSTSSASCALSEEGKTCTLSGLSGDETVEAQFAELDKETLTVNKSGGGQGTVKSKPASINCGLTCITQTSFFYKGTELELSASVTANKGSAFTGFKAGEGSASGCSLITPCQFGIEEPSSVTAEFE
jgi:hypothetical protein